MSAPTSYQVTVDEHVVRVSVRREDEQVFVQVDDGPEQPVTLASSHPPLHALLLGERRAEVLAARGEDGVVAVAVAGLVYQAEVVDEARARLASVVGGRAALHARRELKAPMPGLVVRVLVEAGQTVDAAQPLAVLQAMKMENELSLPRGGTVMSVEVAAGQPVEQGQVLLVVE